MRHSLVNDLQEYVTILYFCMIVQCFACLLIILGEILCYWPDTSPGRHYSFILQIKSSQLNFNIFKCS